MLALPRNLFALEYLKDHAPTISEFKIIWDNVSSDTKKVCDYCKVPADVSNTNFQLEI